MTSAGEALKRFRRARRLSIAELSERTRRQGQTVSASQIGKVERGERRLSDPVFQALADALELSEGERQQVAQAQAGTGAIDVVSAISDLEAKLTGQLSELRGELRASLNLVMDALDRLRNSLRP